MDDKHFIFIGGLHRSGTSLLHEILKSHPDVSGFSGTGVPEDEGQHLQTVYPPALRFGGPGRFGFDPASHMDEHHPLATPVSARRLVEEWGCHWDLQKDYLVEKSPPNLVRTRFLQEIFPGSSFVVLLRHPLAVAYATRKMSRANIGEIIEHSLRCYERFGADLPSLSRVYVLRYEDFVAQPRRHLKALLDWLGLAPLAFDQAVRGDVNARYFAEWRGDRGSILRKRLDGCMTVLRQMARYERRANAFGYSLERPEAHLPLDLAGPRGKPLAPVGAAVAPS